MKSKLFNYTVRADPISFLSNLAPSRRNVTEKGKGGPLSRHTIDNFVGDEEEDPIEAQETFESPIDNPQLNGSALWDLAVPLYEISTLFKKKKKPHQVPMEGGFLPLLGIADLLVRQMRKKHK